MYKIPFLYVQDTSLLSENIFLAYIRALFIYVNNDLFVQENSLILTREFLHMYKFHFYICNKPFF